MPVAYALLDVDGRAIVCGRDGRLYPQGVETDSDRQSVAVATGAKEGSAILIEANGQAIRLDADAEARPVLGLCVDSLSDGGVLLRSGMEGPFLRITEEGIRADVDEESRASAFRFGKQTAAMSDRGLLAKIPAAVSFDMGGLTALFASGEPDMVPVVEALLPVMAIEKVRQAWSGTPDVPERDVFYDLVREQSRERISRFPGYTADRLRDEIALHGWSIGEGTYGYPRIMESGRGQLTIGRYCSMADPWIVLGNHNMSSATSYPFVDLWAEWPGTKAGMADHTSRDVVIGNDVWIGVEAVILPGAVIGDGAVIGAGCVIRGTVQPYAICVGNPAVAVKYRFDEPTRERLLALRWWDWPAARVDRYLTLLLLPDIRAFLDKAEEEDAKRLTS